MNLLSLFKKPTNDKNIRKVNITDYKQKLEFDTILNMFLQANEIYQPEAVIICLLHHKPIEYHFPLTKGFEVHTCNEFLRSLDTGLEITFEGYKQYSEQLCDVLEAYYDKIRS